MNYNAQMLTAYRQTSIKTASQGTLILMLYDEGIKKIEATITLLDVEKLPPSSIEKINNNIIKAQEIITELMASLNTEKGGQIANNLMAIYSYFYQQLLQANIKKDITILKDILSMMKDLRSAWQDVINSEESKTKKA
ncbi:MAG: flagellar export chaperone FliS [Treponema sp.]